MIKRCIPLILCWAALGACAAPPNVLLIVCDDLNDYVETLGGHPQTQTPNIARLIQSGVSFTQAHCNIPICNPSRASFITGIYPHTSQVYGFEQWNANMVLKNSRSMMKHFSAHGYHSLGTGKILHNHGYQEWDEFGNGADYGPFAHDGKKKDAHPDVPAPFRDDFGAVDGSYGPLKNLEGTPYHWAGGNWKKKETIRYTSEDDRDLTADEKNGRWAVEKLKGFAADPDSKPFFMGVGFIRPHTPLIVPQKYFDRFPLDSIRLPDIQTGDVEDTFKRTIESIEDDRSGDRGSKMYDSLVASHRGNRELALRKFIQAYLASVASVDDLVGDMLAVIDGSPLKDNTIIVFTSDHGWGMGEKDYLYKNSLWQESTRVPLAIRAPGVSKAGAQSDRPVSLIDLYPTLLDLCALPSDTVINEEGRALEGHSLKPLLIDPVAGAWSGPDAVLTAMYKWAKYYDPAKQNYSLRNRDWRYIRYENGKEELYHCARDPHEWTNLAGDPEFGHRVATFREQLLARIPASKPAPQRTAEDWKAEYFKKHPQADANQDGTLTWPELQAHKKKAAPGKPTGAPPSERLQTQGVFAQKEAGLVFTDGENGNRYFVINTLRDTVTPHLGKTVKVVAKVKPAKTGNAQLMVHLISIKP